MMSDSESSETKYYMVLVNQEISALIERYQQQKQIDSFGAALNDLIALGYAYWMEGAIPNPKPAYGATIEEDDGLWYEWMSTEGQKPRDEQLDFALWFARRE